MLTPAVEVHEYEVLADGQFRLFSFVNPGANNPQVELSLTAKALSTGPRPAYEAILYVWGEVWETMDIIVNEKKLTISQTRYQILLFLQAFFPERKLLWADALCINQADEKEKAFQVQAMGPIYRFAEKVCVFPGPGFKQLSVTAPEIMHLGELMAESPPPGSVITDAYLLLKNLPSKGSSTWVRLRQFFQLPWFQRLWVVQEATLAIDLIIHCNNDTLKWDDLIALIKGISAYNLTHPINEQLADGKCDLSCQSSGSASALLINQMRSGLLQQHALLQVLHVVGEKLCKDPINRVYAWVWLVPERLRKEITPRYRVPPGTPFEIPWLELNHIALNEYPTLATLTLACTYQPLPQLPSWCINLQSDQDCLTYTGPYCNAGGELLSDVGPYIACSRDFRQIHLRGLEVDTVTEIFEPRWHSCIEFAAHPKCASSSLKWLVQFVEFVNAHQLPIELLLRVLVRDELRDEMDGPLAFDTLRACFRDVIECWSQCGKGTGGTLDLNSAATSRVASTKRQLHKSIRGRRLVLTGKGRLGLAHHTVQTHDRICVFEGAWAPHVLRPGGTEDEPFNYVGDSWIWGLMNTEAFNMGLQERVFVIK